MRLPTFLGTCVVTSSLLAATYARADVCAPPRVMVVLDKSSSMQTGTIGGQTKWNIARGALDTVLGGIEDTAEVGLMTFPQPSQCGPGRLDVAPALNTRGAILAELAEPPPSAGYWTPMAQTLEVAATEPSLVEADAPRYLVLVTDGWQWCDPYDAATRYDGVDAVAALNARGVTTFVVGFGGAADAAALNRMAVEAGTARPGCNPDNDAPSDPDQCYFQADDAAELIAALEDIADVVTDEVCDGQDNDCDGLVDEDLVQSCGTACGSGVEMCVDGAWQGCSAPPVQAEACNGLDDDCDGAVDPGCECAAGDTRGCGETTDAGACNPGVQTCGADGTWGACEGSVGPVNELCNGLDDDCDGQADEASGPMGLDDVAMGLCEPGERCEAGGCVPEAPTAPPTDEEDPTAGFEEGTPAGCGCASTETPGAGAMLLALVGLVALRRRRR